MLELNVSELVNDTHFEASNHISSVAEMGQDAGKITWNNSLNSDCNLITNDEIKNEVIDHFKGFGAWDNLDSWTTNELNALLIQEVSSSIRELDHCTIEESSGRLFECDKGETYFTLGH